MRRMLRALIALATLLGAALPPGAASAQPYPTKPLTLVVGFAPGGSADILARLFAQKLSAALGQPVVVENKPGAGATIATAAVAAAPADGHTLLFVTSGHAGSAALYPKLGYDPIAGFAPIVQVGSSPVVIVVPAASPMRSFADLLDTARRAPGKLNYAGGGGGATTTNLAAEFLKHDAGLYMVPITYRGSGPALIALIAGEIDLGFDIPISALPNLRAGKLRALAVTSRARSATLPEVPTIAETGQAGLKGFDVVGWFGMMAPAGTPPAVVARLNQIVNDALGQADVRERLASVGVEPAGGTAAAFAALIASDTKRYGDAIRRIGVKVD
jgi:tripartite-type tricarboxylate transporter receptor subunit TctC